MLRFLLPALWFGLLTGLGELGYFGVRRYARGLFIFHGWDVLWMTPLANALVFGIVGLLAGSLASRWSRAVTWRGTIGTFAGLASLAILLLFPPLHRLAALLLALGLGFQAARLAARWEQPLETLVRRTTGPLVGLVALMGAGQRGLEWYAERRALAALPAPSPERPNVLLLVLDTVRAMNLGLYGYQRPTSPALDRLSREAVRFDLALSTSPWTLPSHASLFTGLWASQQTSDWFQPLQGDAATLAEVLSRSGYRTAGFVANVWYCSRETGLARGFSHYEDHPVTLGTFLTSASLLRSLRETDLFQALEGHRNLVGRKTAAQINHAFLRWLEGGSARPFFAFLNYYDAHAPYLPPDGYLQKFATPGVPTVPQLKTSIRPGGSWSPEQIQGAIDAYDGALAYVDRELGNLLETLKARGLLEHTLIVVTSDHGEEFNEHGLIHHGHSLYLPSVHVPLLLLWPGKIPAGREVSHPVSIRDVPATIMGLVGLSDSSLFPGHSLARFWADPPAPGTDTVFAEVRRVPLQPAWYPGSKGDMVSAAHSGLRYIREADGQERLFRIPDDPLEQEDLSSRPEHAADLVRFRAILGARGAAR